MFRSDELVSVLSRHLRLGEEFLALVESEARALADGASGLPTEAFQRKKELLPVLNQSLAELKRQRESWQRMTSQERSRFPDIPSRLRAVQDLYMRVIVRDRENEQQLMRRGSVPASQLHRVQPVAKPHFVADLYRRQMNPRSS